MSRLFGTDGVRGLANETLTVELSVQLAQAAAIVPGVTRTGVRRVRYVSPDAYEMIRCFKAVTTLISNAMEERYG